MVAWSLALPRLSWRDLSMGTWWGLAVAVLGVGCAAHRFECERHGGRPVLQIESAHFVVRSDLPEREVRSELADLERLWDAFSVFFKHAPTVMARVPVLLTLNEATSEFIPNTAGFFTAAVEPLLAISVRDYIIDGKVVRGSVSAHELVHLVSRSWLPRQPRWLSEGLAEYLGDARVWRDGSVTFGRWQWPSGAGLLTLDELWAWDDRQPADASVHYGSAWAWLHYLANRDEERLGRLWEALRTQPSPRRAFESVFPPGEHAALHDKVRAYLEARRFRGWESQTLREPQLGPARRLEPWEVHLLRRSIVRVTGIKAEVVRESALAAEVAPHPLPARVEVAIAIDTTWGPARTDVLIANATNPEALLGLGDAPDLSEDEQFAWLERAVARTPDSAAAQLAFARAATARRDERALEASRRAAAAAPWSLDARLTEILALATMGRCPDARVALESASSLGDERKTNVGRRLAQARRQLQTTCGSD